MSTRRRKRSDTEGFRALAWAKFNSFSLEERIAILRETGIPADEKTVNYYFSQLIEAAIEQDMELLGTGWPEGPHPDLIKKT